MKQTIYTVTITHTDDYGVPTGEIETLTYDNLDSAKRAAKRNAGSTITRRTVKAAPEAPKAWYWRGNVVSIIEGRHNGYTLVWCEAMSRDVMANTAELEYR